MKHTTLWDYELFRDKVINIGQIKWFTAAAMKWKDKERKNKGNKRGTEGEG